MADTVVQSTNSSTTPLISAEDLWKRLVELSEAEKICYALYGNLVTYTGRFGGIAAAMVKRYNELADSVNSSLVFVLNLARKYGDAKTGKPVLVPRVVLAATPNSPDINVDDRAILTAADMQVLHLQRENTATPSESTVNPTTLGLWQEAAVEALKWGVRLGFVYFAADAVRPLFSALTHEDTTRITALANLESAKNESRRSTQYGDLIDRCMGKQTGADALRKCIEAAPKELLEPGNTYRPPSDSTFGIFGWITAVAAAGFSVVGLVWLIRRSRRNRDTAELERGYPELPPHRSASYSNAS